METFSARRKRLVLVTLCTGLFMAMLDNLVVGTALPSIGRDLGGGTADLQWVVEAYGLVYASLLLTGGTLGDRWGRRPVYVAGLALFTAGSVGCALAGDMTVLISGRACQGVGAALLTPGSLSILRHVFTGSGERAKAIGIWSGVSGAGLAVGPALGGPLVDHLGWASAFWINVPVGVAGLVAALRVLPDVPRSAARPDPAGQLTGILGLGALVYALVEGPVRGWGDPLVLAGAGGALVVLAAFVVIELRVSSPMLDLRVLSDRVTGTAAFAGFAVSFGFFGLDIFLSLYLQYVLEWSPTAAGVAMLPATLFTAAAAITAGRLCARFGPRLPLAAGLALVGAGLAGFTLYGVGAEFVQFGWLLPVLGCGLGLTFTPISITVMSAVAPERAGMASATVNTLREVGGVAGIAVMGAVLTPRFAAVLRESLAGGGGGTAGMGRAGGTGVQGDEVDAVVRSVTAGGGTGLGQSAALPARTAHAVDAAFVSGLHLAMGVGAALLLGTAALVLSWMRPPVGAPAGERKEEDGDGEGVREGDGGDAAVAAASDSVPG